MAFVQCAQRQGDSLPFSVYDLAFTVGNNGGDCLVVDIFWQQSTPGSGTISVTDSNGNVYTQVFNNEWDPASPGSGWFMSQFVAPNCIGGANTVIVTISSGHFAHLALGIHEYTQVVAASPVDTYDQEWSSYVVPETVLTNTVTTSDTFETLHVFACDYPGTSLSLPFPAQDADGNALSPNFALRVQEFGNPSFADQTFLNSYDAQVTQPPGTTFSTSLRRSGGAKTAPFGLATTVLIGVGNPLTPGAAWILIREPAKTIPTSPPTYIASALQDRTPYLDISEEGSSRHSWTNTLRQRGTAQVALYIKAGDSYDPEGFMGCQVYLYDQSVANGALICFAGTIAQIDTTWEDDAGNRHCNLTVTSFEQCFDALLIPPQTFYYASAGDIFTQIFNSVCGGVPVALGVVNAPFMEASIACKWSKVSDIFSKLATDSSCMWGIDLPTLTVYLKPPDTTPSPFTVVSTDILFATPKWNQNRNDFRNRQVLQISLDAFSQSSELFPVPSSFKSGTPFTVNLLRPAQTVTAAWLTNNTQNHAQGTLSANPTGTIPATSMAGSGQYMILTVGTTDFTSVGAPSNTPGTVFFSTGTPTGTGTVTGDLVITGYPSVGSIYNWVANAPYQQGQIIIDPSNNVQVCTSGNTNGSTNKLSQSPGPPTWDDTPGGTTNDGGLVWTCQGLSGPGGLGSTIYGFVNTLDNTQWGQILVGPNLYQSLLNLQDAINCNTAVQGNTFSWPTWENPLVNASGADGESSANITVTNKPAGAGYVASLGYVGSAFSWGATFTSGGATNLGTYDLQVATNGSSNTANLYYTPGSAIVAVASDPTTNNASYLQVQYQRADGDCIVCENTALVNLRAAIENGTGKYQAFTTDSNQTSNTAGLIACQSALAAFSNIPVSFSFDTLVGGLQSGQLLDISIAQPNGVQNLLNINGSFYVIQEITAELMPVKEPMDTNSGPFAGGWHGSPPPGAGHYRYTITVINVSQIFSYLEFWEGLASGGQGPSAVIGPQGVGTAPNGGSGTNPGGLNPIGTNGNLTPVPSLGWTQCTGTGAPGALTGTANIEPPAVLTIGTGFRIQIIQPGVTSPPGSGYNVTWDSVYKGVQPGAFALDTTQGTQAVLEFMVMSATAIQLMNVAQNGAPTV